MPDPVMNHRLSPAAHHEAEEAHCAAAEAYKARSRQSGALRQGEPAFRSAGAEALVAQYGVTTASVSGIDCELKALKATAVCAQAAVVVSAAAPSLIGGAVAALIAGAVCGLEVGDAYFCYSAEPGKAR